MSNAILRLMSELKTSLDGLAEIAGHEGIVPYPYRDSVGVWTFGIGHTAAAGTPDPALLPRGEAKPLRAVFEVFANDIARYEERVRNVVKVPLKQHQFDALVSFDFNTGGIHRAKLTRKLNDGDLAGAAAAFDGWHRPPEIVGRRNAEKALFRDGRYANSGMATVFRADASGQVQWGSRERVNVRALLAGGTLAATQPDDPGTHLTTEATPESGGTDVAAIAATGLGAVGAVIWNGFGWIGAVVVASAALFLLWRFGKPALSRFLKRNRSS